MSSNTQATRTAQEQLDHTLADSDSSSLSDLEELNQDDELDELEGGSAPEDNEEEEQVDPRRSIRVRESRIAARPWFGTPLPPKNVCSKRLDRLIEMLDDGTIDLNATYQRDVVWPLPFAVAFVTDFFLGVAVRSLVFNVVVRDSEDLDQVHHNEPWKINNQGQPEAVLGPKETWVCADGKQRLTYLSRFMKGHFPLVDVDTKKKYWYIKRKNAQGFQLPQADCDKIAALTLECVCYENLSRNEETYVFRKIQKAIPLTAAETLRAADTPMAMWLSFLVQSYSNDPQTGFNSRICSLPRAKDFLAFAQIHLNQIDGIDKSTSRSGPQLTLRISEDTKVTKSQQDKLIHLLERLVRLSMVERVRNHDAPAERRKFAKKCPTAEFPHEVWTSPKFLAPVEFIWVVTLLDQLKHLSDGQMLEAIELWRAEVNLRHHNNVNQNLAVISTMKKWIKGFKMSMLTNKYRDDGSKTSLPPRAQSKSKDKASQKGSGPPSFRAPFVDPRLSAAQIQPAHKSNVPRVQPVASTSSSRAAAPRERSPVFNPTPEEAAAARDRETSREVELGPASREEVAQHAAPKTPRSVLLSFGQDPATDREELPYLLNALFPEYDGGGYEPRDQTAARLKALIFPGRAEPLGDPVLAGLVAFMTTAGLTSIQHHRLRACIAARQKEAEGPPQEEEDPRSQLRDRLLKRSASPLNSALPSPALSEFRRDDEGPTGKRMKFEDDQ